MNKSATNTPGPRRRVPGGQFTKKGDEAAAEGDATEAREQSVKPEPAGGEGGDSARRTSPPDWAEPRSLAVVRRALERNWDVPANMRRVVPLVMMRIVADPKAPTRDVVNAARVLATLQRTNESAVANQVRLEEVIDLADKLEELQKRLEETR